MFQILSVSMSDFLCTNGGISTGKKIDLDRFSTDRFSDSDIHILEKTKDKRHIFHITQNLR